MDRIRATVTLTFVVAAAYAGITAQQTPQPSQEHGTIWSSSSGQWKPLPDIFPAGGQMQVIHGDPAKGPADFYFRLPAGYGVPWHFHTPVEKVLMDQGTLSVEMRDGKKASLTAGDYMYVPARAPHKVTCTGNTDCLFFLVSGGPFDIHLVDEKNWQTTRSWRASDPVGTTGVR